MCVVQQWPDALFLSKRLATFDLLNVLWDPSTGLSALCRSRRRRTSVGAHFTPDSPLSDAWFPSPDATWGGVAPDTLSPIQLVSIQWTVAHQISLSMGFSRQEYWSGLLFPSPGHLLHLGIEPSLLHWRPILSPQNCESTKPWLSPSCVFLFHVSFANLVLSSPGTFTLSLILVVHLYLY